MRGDVHGSADNRGGDPPPRRRASRDRKPPLALNMTPMIDVVFLIMSYFLMVADFKAREDVMSLDIPHPAPATSQQPAPAPSADPFSLPSRPIRLLVKSLGDGPLDCAISTDSPVLTGRDLRTCADLRRGLESARRTLLEPDQRFVIVPAGQARWEHALAVMNAVERAGFTRLSLAEPGS